MDTLVALGAAAAYGYSAFVTATDADGHYFDTAAVIVTLILVGKVVEARARSSEANRRGGEGPRPASGCG